MLSLSNAVSWFPGLAVVRLDRVADVGLVPQQPGGRGIEAGPGDVVLPELAQLVVQRDLPFRTWDVRITVPAVVRGGGLSG
jgi:hypothetical protein